MVRLLCGWARYWKGARVKMSKDGAAVIRYWKGARVKMSKDGVAVIRML